MMNTSFLLEQCYGARRAGACEPLLAASMGGRAAWPTVRHLADKFGIPLRKQIESGIYNESSGCVAK